MSHSTNEPAIDYGSADPQALGRLRNWGGEALVQDLVRLFKVETPRRMAIACDAATRGDWPAVGTAAHSLKSSCAQLGAVRMRDICAEVEVLAANKTPSEIPSLLASLNVEFTTFNAWLSNAANAPTKDHHE